MPSVQDSKAVLRRRMKDALSQVAAAERKEASVGILAQLTARDEWRKAQTILLFHPMADELDITACIPGLLAEGRRIALPAFDASARVYQPRQVLRWPGDLTTGKYGILEPAAGCPDLPIMELDFILVPGLAFGPNGQRLGRGLGYYDRMLEHARGHTCGLAYDWQTVADLATQPHDVRLDSIVTPTRWITTSGGACER